MPSTASLANVEIGIVTSVPSLSGRRGAALAVTAAAVHGLFDALAYRLPYVVPPYLRLEDAPEMFQMLSPTAVSIAVSSVSGIIGLIAVLAIEPPRRRPVTLAVVVTCFWLFSATLMRIVWLSTPWAETIGGLLFGIPRGVAVGWCLALLSTPRLSASTGAGA
jgi:hypothetical protein